MGVHFSKSEVSPKKSTAMRGCSTLLLEFGELPEFMLWQFCFKLEMDFASFSLIITRLAVSADRARPEHAPREALVAS
jgi:hypothetical protein